MPPDLYSVEEVAQRLNLHVKTVRNFVRAGRLKAIKVGKQYRIARADLEAFAGQSATEPVGRKRYVEASSVVQIDAIDRDAANRVTNTLLASVNGRREPDQPLRIESVYDEERARLKVIIVGSATTTAQLCQLIDLLTKPESP